MRVLINGLIVLGILTIGIAGLGAEVTRAETFVMGVYTDLRTLDPQKMHDWQEGIIGWNIYEGLLEYDVRDYSIQPRLAVSWEVAEDGKSIVFHLRTGVRFHDGTPFNAEAVAFSMERLLALGQTPATYLREVDGWEVLDEFTIRFYKDEPWAFWEDAFASNKGLKIVSPTFVKAHATTDDPWAEEWLTDHACGTGPYILVERVPGQYTKARWNPDYWGGWPTDKVFFKEVVHMPVLEASLRSMLIQTGELDYTTDPPLSDLPILQDDPDVVVHLVPAFAQQFIFFNCKNPPLDDPRLRKAIALAIDYKAVNETYLPNLPVARGILPSTVPGFNPNIPESRRDIEEAKRILQEAGYIPEQIRRLELVPIAGTWQVDAAQIVAANLAELGIRVIINPTPWSVYQWLRLSSETMPDMSFMYLELFLADALAIIEEGFTPDSVFAVGYVNEEVGRLADIAETLPRREERWEIYKRIQELVYPDYPAIYLHERVHQFLIRADVEGFVPDRMHLFVDVHRLWRKE